MKKARKHLHTPQQHSPSPKNSAQTNAPPESFISEMATLFRAGDLGRLEQQANEAIRLWPRHFFGWKALGNLLLMRGKPAGALAPLLHAIKLAPSDAQVHHNLGVAFLRLDRFTKAETNLRQALALNPDYVQAHSNLGIVLLELGRLDEAEACFRQALLLKPDFAEAHNNLGNALKELGRPEEAEASYRQALALKPDYVQAHSGLGEALLKLGRLGEAIAGFRKALELDSRCIKALDGLNQALSRVIPLWHVPMMNDAPRNAAYFDALQAAITPNTHVLEIGTGSGLLAMMAARLGARQVTTCEAVSEIAETARAIVAANNCTPPVTVVGKLSNRMQIGVDMEDRADLLVSEILSNEFLGEDVLPSIEDAKRRLLKPGARIIPARGSIQFALCGGAEIERNIRVGEVYGFDLRPFNALVPRKQNISRNDLNIELLSDAASAFFFDFNKTACFPMGERQVIEVQVRKAGRCCGIIQWIRLEMDDSVVFENHPAIENSASGWQHCLYVFPEPLDMLPGQVAVITAVHNRNTPWFFCEGLK